MITICTAADPLPELEQYVDLDVLPRIINPNGHGEAWPEFGSIVWEGGPLPATSLASASAPTRKHEQQQQQQQQASEDSQKTRVTTRQRRSRGAPPKRVISLGVGGF